MLGTSPATNSGPSVVDRAFQLAYVVAYRLMRTYWMLRHPTTHGALVAIWCGGQVLLVRNSYVPYYSAPGGYVDRNETPRDAALRELAEEIGLRPAPERLEAALETTHEWEGKHDHVVIFTLDLDERPPIEVDHREVVAANWFPPEQALQLDVFPPLKQVIAQRLHQDGRSA